MSSAAVIPNGNTDWKVESFTQQISMRHPFHHVVPGHGNLSEVQLSRNASVFFISLICYTLALP